MLDDFAIFDSEDVDHRFTEGVQTTLAVQVKHHEVAFGDDIASSQQRWYDELNARRTLPPERFLAEFGKLIDDAGGDVSLRDDLTMLILEIR